MFLTLEDIQTQQFNQRFRGYDMAEVDGFLDKLAESYLFISTENDRLKEELSGLQNAQTLSLEEEQSFKNAIIAAQSFADDIKTKAEAHAARLQEDAKDKSTAILEEAQREENSLQIRITTLAGEKERIKAELRSFLNTYLNRIDDDSLAISQAADPVNIVTMEETPEPMGVLELESSLDYATEERADDEVAILYEKIVLTDDFSPAGLSEVAETEPSFEGESAPETAGDKLDALAMGDIDDDMLYSLDDLLDSQEPAVVIDPLDDKDN